jgi:glycosyltransferase involved in cell wall biosynthesis
LKISIITVTHNCELVLSDCLNSVASQKYKNIEHIIIDNASNDGTISLLNSKRDQFALLVSEKDKGIYDAMNKGIKLATGDIIGFLNSDDFYIHNEVISRVVREFKKKTSLEACYSDLVYVNKNYTSKIVRYFKSCEFKKGLFSKGWCPPHPTFFVRKSVYEKYGNFNLDYCLAADVELMMRFFEVHKIKSHYIPEVWVKMRMGGTTNKSLKNILIQNLEILNSLKKNGLRANPVIFFLYKLISRAIQFLKR